MAEQSQMLWQPASHLGSGFALKHAAPQLVGRLPRMRANSFQAAARLAQKGAALHLAKMAKPAPASVKPPAPPVTRMGPSISNGPPAGSSMPKQMTGPLSTKMPSLPKAM